MRAVVVEEFGGPEVLRIQEVPDPVAGSGELLVEVAAADVLHVDAMIRAGLGQEIFPQRPPYVPGGGVAGLTAGRRVAGRTTGGGYAEKAVVPAASAAVVPDPVGLRTAAALVHDGPTALRLADVAQVREGDRVLVLGAAGGAANLLVQLASLAGARVVGAARGEAKLASVKQAGADEAVDYGSPDWPGHAREALGGEADVVFDGVGGPLGATAFVLVAPGGRFAGYGTPSGSFTTLDPDDVARRGVSVTGIDVVQMGPEAHTELLRRALADAAAGRLEPILGPDRSLDAATEAHRALEERRAVGKTLLLT